MNLPLMDRVLARNEFGIAGTGMVHQHLSGRLESVRSICQVGRQLHNLIVADFLTRMGALDYAKKLSF